MTIEMVYSTVLKNFAYSGKGKVVTSKDDCCPMGVFCHLAVREYGKTAVAEFLGVSPKEVDAMIDRYEFQAERFKHIMKRKIGLIENGFRIKAFESCL